MRFALHFCARSARQALALQLLHGPAFALNWCAAVEAVDLHATAAADRHAAADDDAETAAAPRGGAGLRATAQAALNTAYFAVGSGIGNLLFGALYDAGGARSCYLVGALLMLATGAVAGADLEPGGGGRLFAPPLGKI